MNRRQFLMGLVGAPAIAAATVELAQAAALPEAAGTVPNSGAMSVTDADYSILMRAMVRRGTFPTPGRKWRHKPRIGRRHYRR